MDIKPKLASAMESSKVKGKELLVKGKEVSKVAAVKGKEQGLALWQKVKLILVPLVLKFVIFYKDEFVIYLKKEADKSTNKLDDLAVAGFAKVLEVLAEQQEKKESE